MHIFVNCTKLIHIFTLVRSFTGLAHNLPMLTSFTKVLFFRRPIMRFSTAIIVLLVTYSDVTNARINPPPTASPSGSTAQSASPMAKAQIPAPSTAPSASPSLSVGSSESPSETPTTSALPSEDPTVQPSMSVGSSESPSETALLPNCLAKTQLFNQA